MSDQRDLVSPEGVDEGSADSTVEGPDSGSDDVGGTPPQGRGTPVDPAQAAAPDDVETSESRAARAAQGTGQQYQVGEG